MRRTSAVTASAFALEYQCPQCGAPVSLEETDRLFSCPYCRVRHVVHSPGILRYFLPPRTVPGDDAFYVPYWRCKGLKIVIQERMTKRDIIDRSQCALTGPVKVPPLGARSQTLVMKIIGPDTPGVFLPPTVTMREFIGSLEAPSVSALFPFAGSPADMLTVKPPVAASAPPGQGMYEKRDEGCCILIGEVFSLLYAPFFRKASVLYDGITGRAIGPAQDTGLAAIPVNGAPQAASPGTPEQPFQTAAFIPALCPACGKDLLGERESCLLACTDCRCVYEPRDNGLKAEDFFVAWPLDKADLWVPFWVISVSCAAAPLSTVADFYRLAGIPRPILAADERRPVYFWVPAFKSNPELFFRLGKSFTMQQVPHEKPVAMPPKVFPVTLPASEAFQSIPVFLAEMAPARKKIFPVLKNVRLSLMTASVVYVPFTDTGAEYVQTHCNMAISKNALRVGKGL